VSDDSRFTIRVPKKLVFGLITVALILGLAEAGQRLYERHKQRDRGRPDDTFSDRHETTGGVPLSDKPGAMVNVLHPHRIFALKPDQRLPGLTINAQGFRGRDWTKEKPPGVARVIVLGSSTAFGLGVRGDDRIFTALLERRLDEAPPDGRRVEVLNAAVGAYNSTQELILLTTELLDYSPDAVLVFDGFNDFYIAAGTPPEAPLVHAHFDETQEVIRRGRQTGLNILRLSAIFRRVENTLRDLGPRSEFGRIHPAGLALYGRNLEKICRVAKAYGAAVVLVSQPELFQRAEPVPEADRAVRAKRDRRGYGELARREYPRFVAEAARVARAEGALHVDGTEAFDGHPEAVFTDWCHLTERGHELVADQLLPVVARALGAARGGRAVPAGPSTPDARE